MAAGELYRSVLYMPGSNERALEKAKGFECDALIFDLEDAVHPDKKEYARQLATDFVISNRDSYGSKKILIRVNAWDTTWGRDDFCSVSKVTPDGILLPKINSGKDFNKYIDMLKEPLNPKIKIWAMVETPSAIINLNEIAGAVQNLEGFVLGTNDLTKDLNITSENSRQALITILSTVNLVAKSNRLVCLDGVYNAFKDLDGLKLECEQGKRFGFDGKTLIHPCQIDTTNAVFSPSEDEVEIAKKYVEAFSNAQNSGSGVAVVNGKIVENLHVEMAKNILHKVELIEQNNVRRGEDL